MNLSTLGTFLWRHRGRLRWRYFPRVAVLLVAAAWNSYMSLFNRL